MDKYGAIRHDGHSRFLHLGRRFGDVLGRRFEHWVGVVEATVGVRAADLAARLKGRAIAKTTVAWLEELVAARCEELAE